MDKSNKKFYIKIAIAFLVIAFLLYRSPKSTGSIYAPDMTYSNALETYGVGPIATLFGKDRVYMASMLPVANTIPTDALPPMELYLKDPSVVKSYRYKSFYQNNDIDKAKAGAELKNPYEPTDEVMARGKFVYDQQCSICHGATGMGDGPLIVRPDGTDGAYKAIPPAYKDRLPTLKDGEMYHSIVYGKNLMGGYAPHVKADDRWKVICYIKGLAGMNGTATASKDSTSQTTASADTTKK